MDYILGKDKCLRDSFYTAKERSVILRTYDEITKIADILDKMEVVTIDDTNAMAGYFYGLDKNRERRIQIFSWFEPSLRTSKDGEEYREHYYYALIDENRQYLSGTIEKRLSQILLDKDMLKYILDGEETAVEEF